MNTEISYMYRDGCNFKRRESIVVAGEIRFEDIAPYLSQGTDFIPGQVGLEPLNNYDADIDGPYNELSAADFQPTEDKATIKMTAQELIEAFRKAHESGWDASCFDSAIIERLSIANRIVEIPEEINQPGPFTIRMQSEAFGSEAFTHSSLKAALEGVIRLYDEAMKLDDGIERIIGIMVNPQREKEDVVTVYKAHPGNDERFEVRRSDFIWATDELMAGDSGEFDGFDAENYVVEHPEEFDLLKAFLKERKLLVH